MTFTVKNTVKRAPAGLLAGVLFALLGGPGGALAESRAFPAIPDGLEKGALRVQGGKAYQEGSRTAWTVPLSGEKVTAPEEFIALDPSVVSLAEGSVLFTLRRLTSTSSGTDMDTVLSLDDSRGDSIFTVAVTWEGRESSYLRVDGPFDPEADRLWDHSIPLGRKVGKGETVTVLLTWGETPEKNRVFVDGREAATAGSRSNAPAPRPFRDLIGKDLAGVLVGMQHYRDWPGIVWDPLNDSALTRLAFLGWAAGEEEAARLTRGAAIASVSHDAAKAAGYSGKLVEGDALNVTLAAEPGGTATFDLGTHRGLPLAEDPERPGTYTGPFTVPGGDLFSEIRVVGRFTDRFGFAADPKASARTLSVDSTVHLAVNPSNDLIPADRTSLAGVTVKATDANGKPVRKHPIRLTLSTTDDYTGTVGAGDFSGQVGGDLEVDWGGVTDSFGEVTAQYRAGFAAKTAVISAKDMATGDVGAGAVRSFISGSVDILVKEAPSALLQLLNGRLEVSLSRDWLTADGVSRSRVTARVLDERGDPVKGDQVAFTLLGRNGQIRVLQGRTDAQGRAQADYIAGVLVGEALVEVRDLTRGLSRTVSIELRADAPAEVTLKADPGEILLGDREGSLVTAKVSDVNGNPNLNTEVAFSLSSGEGSLTAEKALTDARQGTASVTFHPGAKAGAATVRATIMSRAPSALEIEAARGAVFLFGLEKDPGELTVMGWLAEPKSRVVRGQDLVRLEDRKGVSYLARAGRDGTLQAFVAEEGDPVEMGDTLGYILP